MRGERDVRVMSIVGKLSELVHFAFASDPSAAAVATLLALIV